MTSFFRPISRVLAITAILNGVSGAPTSSNKAPTLVCHVPLELKIFGDTFQATSADLKPCHQIILSSFNTLFLPNINISLASTIVSEKRNLDLLKQQTPEAAFIFSLRSNYGGSARNLKTIFSGIMSIPLLVEFLRVNKLKGLDIAWDLIQSTPDYMAPLKGLKAALAKEGFELTTTIGSEMNRTNATHIVNIASVVDRIFLVSIYNRFYSGVHPLVTREPGQAFDSLELNEGAFLQLYSSLNLSFRKVVVGLSLQSLVWKVSGSATTIGATSLTNQRQASLQLESYNVSCKIIGKWETARQQPSPFYRLAVAPSKDQWMVHVDPLTLSRRVDLIKHYGFAGVALYDYHQDDFAGVCSSSGQVYPLIQQAGLTIRSSNPSLYSEIDPSSGLCLPFLNLTSDCRGAFNFGTPKPIETTTLVPTTRTGEILPNRTTSQMTTLSFVSSTSGPSTQSTVTQPQQPVVVTRNTEEPYQNLTENPVAPSHPSKDGTVFDPITSEAPVAVAEHLVRTTRSSISEKESVTQSSPPLKSSIETQLLEFPSSTERVVSLEDQLVTTSLPSSKPTESVTISLGQLEAVSSTPATVSQIFTTETTTPLGGNTEDRIEEKPSSGSATIIPKDVPPTLDQGLMVDATTATVVPLREFETEFSPFVTLRNVPLPNDRNDPEVVSDDTTAVNIYHTIPVGAETTNSPDLHPSEHVIPSTQSTQHDQVNEEGVSRETDASTPKSTEPTIHMETIAMLSTMQPDAVTSGGQTTELAGVEPDVIGNIELLAESSLTTKSSSMETDQVLVTEPGAEELQSEELSVPSVLPDTDNNESFAPIEPSSSVLTDFHESSSVISLSATTSFFSDATYFGTPEQLENELNSATLTTISYTEFTTLRGETEAIVAENETDGSGEAGQTSKIDENLSEVTAVSVEYTRITEQPEHSPVPTELQSQLSTDTLRFFTALEMEKQISTGSAYDHKTFEYLSETENFLVIETSTASITESISSESPTSQPLSNAYTSDDELTSQLVEDSFVGYQSAEITDKSFTPQPSAGELTDAFTSSFEVPSVNLTEIPSNDLVTPSVEKTRDEEQAVLHLEDVNQDKEVNVLEGQTTTVENLYSGSGDDRSTSLMGIFELSGLDEQVLHHLSGVDGKSQQSINQSVLSEVWEDRLAYSGDGSGTFSGGFLLTEQSYSEVDVISTTTQIEFDYVDERQIDREKDLYLPEQLQFISGTILMKGEDTSASSQNLSSLLPHTLEFEGSAYVDSSGNTLGESSQEESSTFIEYGEATESSIFYGNGLETEWIFTSFKFDDNNSETYTPQYDINSLTTDSPVKDGHSDSTLGETDLHGMRSAENSSGEISVSQTTTNNQTSTSSEILTETLSFSETSLFFSRGQSNSDQPFTLENDDVALLAYEITEMPVTEAVLTLHSEIPDLVEASSSLSSISPTNQESWADKVQDAQSEEVSSSDVNQSEPIETFQTRPFWLSYKATTSSEDFSTKHPSTTWTELLHTSTSTISSIDLISSESRPDTIDTSHDFATRPSWLLPGRHTSTGSTDTPSVSVREESKLWAPIKAHTIASQRIRKLSSTLKTSTVSSPTPEMPASQEHNVRLDSTPTPMVTVVPLSETTEKPESSASLTVLDNENPVLNQVNISTTDGRINGLLDIRKGHDNIERLLVFRHSETPAVVKSNGVCQNSGESILLKSICKTRSPKASIPPLTEITSRLRSILMANLALNASESSTLSSHSTVALVTSTEASVIESPYQRLASVLKAVERNSTTENRHVLQNVKDDSVTNDTLSAVEFLMTSLAERLKHAQLQHVVSAVNYLNQSIIPGFLDELLNSNSSTNVEQARIAKEVLEPEPTSVKPDNIQIYSQDFRKINRPPGVVFRDAGPHLRRIPLAGRLWRTITHAPSTFHRIQLINNHVA